MALALRFEQLLREGEIKSYAELARLGHVSRARVSQSCDCSRWRRRFKKLCCSCRELRLAAIPFTCGSSCPWLQSWTGDDRSSSGRRSRKRGRL
jgi:hypothetical protein